MAKTIVFPVALDTKGEEAKYIKQKIEKSGHKVIVIDVGVLGKPLFKADILREEVSQAGGKRLGELIAAAEKGADRTEGTNVMIDGLKKIVEGLHAKGELDGIIALGGSTGTAVGTEVMRVLPIGVPKLMVSTWLEDAKSAGAKDITVMQTPADILGLNSVMRKTLANAAGAIVGMAEAEVPEPSKPLIGITSLGVTTPGVMKIWPFLDERGYEPIVFHAKTEVLDELAEAGRVSGIIDLTPYDMLWPLTFSPPQPMAEDRLRLAGEKGVPQVIAPGGLDLLILRGITKDAIPSEYKNRILHVHGPHVVLVRTTKDEVGMAARLISERANRAVGPIAIVIPLRGFSAVDKESQHFYAPDVDDVFAQVVKKTVDERVRVVEVDAHINDDEFVEKIISSFDEITKKGGI